MTVTADQIISLNKVLAEPRLIDVLNLLAKDIRANLNCHAVATIQSFDSETQKVTATINYKKTYIERNATTKTYSPKQVDYPLLVDVPIVMLQGGTAALTFPIAAGDTCLILFNDRDMDNWLYSGQVLPVNTPRMHSFADGIALIGLRASNNPLADYDEDRAVLRNDKAYVGVGAQLVKIGNDLTTLKELLEGLIDILASGFNAATPAMGAPLSATTATALNNYKNDVEDLLE